MTVPVHVLAAVRSIPHPAIPHPRQEPDMTAPDPSPAEQAVIDRFESAEPAEESDPRGVLAHLNQRREQAYAEVFGLCDGSRRWTMRVPVDETRDSDTVIVAGLQAGEDAADMVRRVLDLADELDRDAFQDEDGGWAAGQRYSAGRIRAAIAAPVAQAGGGR